MNNKHTLYLFRQVREYIATLPPDTKKKFNGELKKLAQGGGDVHPLKKDFEGFHRLRVGQHRVIYAYALGMKIDCFYADPRETIYQIFVPSEIVA